jgi:hypothetical protein
MPWGRLLLMVNTSNKVKWLGLRVELFWGSEYGAEHLSNFPVSSLNLHRRERSGALSKMIRLASEPVERGEE